MPRRSEGGVSVHVSGAAVAPAKPVARAIRPTAPSAASAASAPRRKASLVARRRRLFLVLGAVTFLTFVLAVAGVMSWVVQSVFDLLLVGFCVHLRAQARRAPRARQTGTALVARQSRRAAVATSPKVARPAPARTRPAATPRPAAAESTPSTEQFAQEELAATGTEDTWEPVPVPRPTYTLKPPAPVEVPIDMIDPLRDTDPHNTLAASSFEDYAPPGSEVIATEPDEVETDLDEILQRRWA